MTIQHMLDQVKEMSTRFNSWRDKLQFEMELPKESTVLNKLDTVRTALVAFEKELQAVEKYQDQNKTLLRLCKCKKDA